MTIDEARVWLQHHADNTPMPGAREAYRTILEALGNDNCQDEKMDVKTATRLLRFERSERYPKLPGFLKMRDALEMAINALERTRWIPVEERLPEELKPVLFAVYPRDKQLYNKYGKVVYLAWRENGEWLDWEGKRVSDVFIVTHWMPLPCPPKENRNE